MLGLIAAFTFLFVVLFGYYKGIKMSKLEKEIRKKNLPYNCFECKKEISINEIKCPHCSFETIYGTRKKKYWIIFPILGIWIFLVAKFFKRGII